MKRNRVPCWKEDRDPDFTDVEEPRDAEEDLKSTYIKTDWKADKDFDSRYTDISSGANEDPKSRHSTTCREPDENRRSTDADAPWNTDDDPKFVEKAVWKADSDRHFANNEEPLYHKISRAHLVFLILWRFYLL